MTKINNYIYLSIVFFLFSCGTGEYFGFEEKNFSQAKNVLRIGIDKFPKSQKIRQLRVTQLVFLRDWDLALKDLDYICKNFPYEYNSWKLKIKLLIFKDKEYQAKKNLIGC